MKIKKYAPHIVLAVIILVQIFTYIFLFSAHKSVFYEDEYFSYGLANSYYKPFLYGSEFKKFDNYNTWLSGDDFKYYIQTNDDTAFSYGSVYSNQAKDTMPPLYYIIIHTISSVFKNRFSWWWGFCVNLAVFALTQVFLYKIFSKLSKSEWAGMLACIFFGFSIAGQNIQLYIRMYSMLTMFAVMFVFFAQRVLTSEDNDKKNLIFIAAVTFLGAMTHHLFLVFAFIYTLLQCIYFLLKKKFKKMFAFGLAALAGVILSFIAFIPSVYHLFFQDMKWTEKPDALLQLHLLKELVFFELFGVEKLPVILRAFTDIGLVCVVIFCVIMRKSNQVKSFFAALRKHFCGFVKSGDFTGVIAFLASVLYIVFISGRFSYFDVIDRADKYIFITVPFFCGAVISAAYSAAMLIPKKAVKNVLICIISVITAGVLAYQNICFDSFYAKSSNPQNGSISEYVENKDCILLLNSSVFLPCYTTTLKEADDVFVSIYRHNEYITQENEYRKIFEDNNEVYLIFDDINIRKDNTANDSSSKKVKEDDMLQYFENLSGFKYTYCTKETVDNFTVKLYRFEKDK